MSKSAYIQQITVTVTAIAQSLATAQTLVDTYFDRGYGSGGTNEIVAGDLVNAELTPSQISSGITLFQQLHKLMNNQTIETGDYDATLNVLRRDL